VAKKTKKLLHTLARRGPHKVLRGDLAFVGTPGLVLTPAAGMGLPAVAFGHHWLSGPEHYLSTLAHLASWGLVVVAPGTERGVAPSGPGLAADLHTALDVATGVRLGPGEISVDPQRLALAGHGFGAGAALLAAAQRPVGAVGALFPAQTVPATEPAAAQIHTPTLLLSESGTGGDPATPIARSLAQALPVSSSVVRSLPGASATDLFEGRRVAAALGVGGGDRRVRALVRGLLTGFLLGALGDGKTAKEYAQFLDPDEYLPETAPLPAQAPPQPHPAAALLRS